MAASVEAIARQLQALIEHVNALNTQMDERATAMADYPRMQVAMNKTRDKLGLVVQQIDALGVSGGKGSGSGDSDFLVQKKDLRVENFHGDEAKFQDFVEEATTYGGSDDRQEWIQLLVAVVSGGHDDRRVRDVLDSGEPGPRRLSQGQVEGQGGDLAQVAAQRRSHQGLESHVAQVRPVDRQYPSGPS